MKFEEEASLAPIAKIFRSLVTKLSQFTDLIYGDGFEVGSEILSVSGTISFFLSKSPLYLRKVDALPIYEALMLISAKVFQLIRITLEQAVGGSLGNEELRNSSCGLILEIQYVLSDFLMGIYTFRKRSFRQLYAVPELFNTIKVFLGLIPELMKEGLDGYYVNSEDRAIDFLNLIKILKKISKDDFSLIQCLQTELRKVQGAFEKITDFGEEDKDEGEARVVRSESKRTIFH